MKSKSIGLFFVGLTLVLGFVVIAPHAFADHQKVEVTMANGSGKNPDAECVASNSCFQPSNAIVDVGGEVTWTNTDTAVAAVHTVTSGDPADEASVGAVFDSASDGSLMSKGNTFSFVFDKAGTYPYFCQVHAWMRGTVTVQEAMAEEGEPKEETYASAMSADGSVNVKIESSIPAAGDEMSIKATFTDADGNPSQHVNYQITAKQDGEEVLSEKGHAHPGASPTLMTNALTSDSPVDIEVTILGIGLPDEEANWTAPKGDVIKLQVVPEFGTIAALVLAISIVSIIAVTAKTRVIPKL